MDEAGILIYLAVKAAATIAWCGQGARLHGHTDRLVLRAFTYGTVRMTMGAMGLFLILWLASALSGVIPSGPPLYLLVYLPIRWLEWSIVAVIMDLDRRSAHNLFVGDIGASRLLRVGGMVISCLFDLPMIVSEALPHQWFVC